MSSSSSLVFGGHQQPGAGFFNASAAASMASSMGLPATVSVGGSNWAWTCRLRRYNPEEARWVEKGPVVLMVLPAREESPWEARFV
jgi:hypothetical protein